MRRFIGFALAVITLPGCSELPAPSAEAEPAASANTPALAEVAAVTVGGCGKSAPTGDMLRNVTVQNAARSYLLSVPASYRSDRALPLYFLYHGRGGDHTALMPLGFQQSALAVFPDGQVQAAEGTTGWDESASGNDVAMFDAVLATVAAGYCVDPTRIYAVGFSWGGWMSNALGCLRGKSIGGIASIEGGVQNKIGDCVGPVPAWIHHYRQDPAEPFTSGQAAAAFFEQLDGDTSSTTYDAAHACVEFSGRAPVVFCSPNGAVHAVPDYALTSIQNFFLQQQTRAPSVPANSPGSLVGLGLAIVGALHWLTKRRDQRAMGQNSRPGE